MRGIDRIASAFSAKAGIKLMTHAVVGYPDLPTSERILRAMADSGADFIEAQLPFSDPVADGPSIVEANHVALRAGSRTAACLGLLARLRGTTSVPILIMAYLNTLLAQGIEEIVRRIADIGLDGLIVPDWPDDEPEFGLGETCAEAGLALVPLIAPSTSLERASALASASASPFVYAVTRLGVTGRRTEFETEALERLASLRAGTGRFVAAGFGIRERAQVGLLEGYADCAIVGTALVDAARMAHRGASHGGPATDPAEAIATLVADLAGKG